MLLNIMIFIFEIILDKQINLKYMLLILKWILQIQIQKNIFKNKNKLIIKKHIICYNK